VKEDYDEVESETSMSLCMSDTSSEVLDISNIPSSSFSSVKFQIDYKANSCLNLESAIQFAGLVAAYHVHTKTRDLNNLDIGSLLDRSIVSLSPVVSNEI